MIVPYFDKKYADDKAAENDILTSEPTVNKPGKALNLAMVVLAAFAPGAILGCNNGGIDSGSQTNELVERGLDYKLAEARKRVDKYHSGDLAKQLKDAYQKISDMPLGEFNRLCDEYDPKKIEKFYGKKRLKELFPEGMSYIEKLSLFNEMEGIQEAINNLGDFTNF